MANELKPWSRKITNASEIKAGERVLYLDDVGLIAVNINDPKYKVWRAEKLEKRKAKKKAITEKRKAAIAKRIMVALQKGKRMGAREFKNSKAFTKLKESLYKKALKASKPKQSKVERILKKKAKIESLKEEIKHLETV